LEEEVSEENNQIDEKSEKIQKETNILEKFKKKPQVLQKNQANLEKIHSEKAFLQNQKNFQCDEKIQVEKPDQRTPLSQQGSKNQSNISQIKALNFQRKKTGLGGGHIPQNNVIESKLGLLKEMIKKSIEKRPQSADPFQKPQRSFQHLAKNPLNKDILPSIKQEKSQIEPLDDLDQEVFPLFQKEKTLINSILTIKSQQGETKERFFSH